MNIEMFKSYLGEDIYLRGLRFDWTDFNNQEQSILNQVDEIIRKGFKKQIVDKNINAFGDEVIQHVQPPYKGKTNFQSFTQTADIAYRFARLRTISHNGFIFVISSDKLNMIEKPHLFGTPVPEDEIVFDFYGKKIDRNNIKLETLAYEDIDKKNILAVFNEDYLLFWKKDGVDLNQIEERLPSLKEWFDNSDHDGPFTRDINQLPDLSYQQRKLIFKTMNSSESVSKTIESLGLSLNEVNINPNESFQEKRKTLISILKKRSCELVFKNLIK